jgi:hypothetical protein
VQTGIVTEPESRPEESGSYLFDASSLEIGVLILGKIRNLRGDEHVFEVTERRQIAWSLWHEVKAGLCQPPIETWNYAPPEQWTAALITKVAWATLACWANFQPRKRPPRRTPGQVFYPAEFSHVFEKYWDYLPNLSQSPGFARESTFCQCQMNSFSEFSAFEPLVSAEASDKAVQVSEEAAISLLRPIQDDLDFWGVHGGAVK